MLASQPCLHAFWVLTSLHILSFLLKMFFIILVSFAFFSEWCEYFFCRLQKYYISSYLISDLKVIGWSPSYDTIEIGSLGHLPSSSLEAISHIVSQDSSSLVTSILLEAAKVVIACSHQIFLAHKQITWSSSRPMIN